MPRRHGLAVLATLVGIAFLAAALVHLDRAAVAAVLGRARLWPWLPLGVASYLIGHRLRGHRLRRLVSHEVALTTNVATSVVVAGYASNNLLPARLGELVRAWLLMERSGLSIAQTLTITVVERLLDAFVLLVLFWLATSLLPASPIVAMALPVAGGLLALTALVLALGVWTPGPVLALASHAAQRFPPRAHDVVMRQVHGALGGLEALRRPRHALAVLGLSLSVWIAEAGLFAFLLPAFDLAADPRHALFAMTGTNLGVLLPSTPGFVGPFHFFCTQSLVALGVPREVGFGYAVLVHAAFFVPITFWGVAVIASHGLSVGRALTLSREAGSLPAGVARLAPRVPPPAEAAPSRFFLALAEAAVPVDRDRFADAEARPIVLDVASFVAGQMRELPVRLRAQFQIGLAGFRVVTRLRYARGFCELPPVTRREWFEHWAYGPLPLARLLFRPVRSTALLAYYERPEVRERMDAAAPVAGAEAGGPASGGPR